MAGDEKCIIIIMTKNFTNNNSEILFRHNYHKHVILVKVITQS